MVEGRAHLVDQLLGGEAQDVAAEVLTQRPLVEGEGDVERRRQRRIDAVQQRGVEAARGQRLAVDVRRALQPAGAGAVLLDRARLLRREGPAIGLSRDFVIYDSSDQISVVKQALKSLDIDDKFIQPRAALSRISHAKNRMETPEQMSASAGWNRRDENIAKVYAKYLAALKEASALDFDDLLLKTVEVFESSAEVRQKYAEQYRFVMVDEYQDTNRPQYLLIRRIVRIDL